MTFTKWLLAALISLACAMPAFAAPDPIGYTAPDGVNAIAVTAANPLPVGATSPANFTPNQVSVAASGGGGTNGATLIVAARTGRNTVVIENSGTTAVYLGPSAVQTSTGLLLPGVLGSSVTLQTSAAIYGITATGTATVSYAETY